MVADMHSPLLEAAECSRHYLQQFLSAASSMHNSNSPSRVSSEK